MITGKLPNDLLEEKVFKYIKHTRDDILTGASVGEDNALVDFGEEVAVLSTDPITGAAGDIGRLALEISVNDISTSGGEAIGVLMTILAPKGTSYEDIEQIMKDAGETAERLNVEIMGGHTEITDAVNKVVVSTTVIGKVKKKDILKIHEIKNGDKVMVTKSIGIEGTSILLNDYESFFKDKMDSKMIEEGKGYGEKISVKEEGRLGGLLHVNYMHDITEGGILGAVWEAHKAIKMGIQIYEKSIPITDTTKTMCSILGINPMRLISSGSMLVIGDERIIKEMIEKLEAMDISASIIGEVTDKGVYIERGERLEEIEPPQADELYSAIAKLKKEIDIDGR
nr:AIR synthase family protein [Tissierella sp.]